MKKVIIISIIVAVMAGAGYGGFFLYKKMNQGKKSENVAEQGITPETAKYKLEFIAYWSEETHPGHYPTPEHGYFSPFVAYSHSETAKVFEEGGMASLGIEEMAETGKTLELNAEINTFLVTNRALEKVKGNQFGSPGDDFIELNFNKDNYYFTLVSMVGHSPDWFVAQTGSLVRDNKWIDSLELDLVTYDAGTDNGETFTSPDSETSPKESISRLGIEMQGLGKLVLTRVQ